MSDTNNNTSSEQWTAILEPRKKFMQFNLKEMWDYRDLYRIYVRRNIVTVYKQTVLGLAWFFISPIFTTIMYMFVFGGLAGISTGGVPQAVFYLSGILMWNYFNACFGQNSNVLAANAGIFGKVYFPRLIVPISTVVSNLLRFGIQLGLFLVVYAIYQIWIIPGQIHTNWYALLLPVLVLMLAGLALGFGILFSSMTTKYRDMSLLLSYFVSLWMYATPVIYPLSTITNEKLRMLMSLNPLTGIVEAFKYGFLGEGQFSWGMLGYSASFMVVLLALGIVIFNRVQKTFMDTV